MMLEGGARPRNGGGQLCRMDPTVDGNPIGWTIRTLGKKLPMMLERAGYAQIAAAADFTEVARVLPEVGACARELYATRRNTVKHNRGTHIFEAGNIRFGLEMRRLSSRLISGSRLVMAAGLLHGGAPAYQNSMTVRLTARALAQLPSGAKSTFLKRRLTTASTRLAARHR